MIRPRNVSFHHVRKLLLFIKLNLNYYYINLFKLKFYLSCFISSGKKKKNLIWNKKKTTFLSVSRISIRSLKRREFRNEKKLNNGGLKWRVERFSPFPWPLRETGQICSKYWLSDSSVRRNQKILHHTLSCLKVPLMWT